MIDVSGLRSSTPLPTRSHRAAGNATNRTVIHVLELSDLVTAGHPLEYLPPPTPGPPTPLPFTTLPTTPPTTTVPVRPTETVDVRPGRPVVVYFRRRDAGPGVGVLEVVPALTALRDGERCDLTAGDGKDLFVVRDGRGGLWSLQFTRRAVDIGVYRLQLTCWPLSNASTTVTQLQPFSFSVELHVH